MRLEDVWPLFALRLVTPRLELRPMRDDDLPGLVDAALAGIHEADRMPFGVPWTDAPPRELARSLVQYHWRMRASVAPERWGIGFTVLLDGVPIGIQEMHAHGFAALRTIGSASWLTLARQGAGLGTEMRAALLLFVFDHLGAEWAESSAADWNTRSLRVSARLGYTANGRHRVQPRPGEVVDEVRMRLHRDDFVRPRWRLRAHGVDVAREFLLGAPV